LFLLGHSVISTSTHEFWLFLLHAYSEKSLQFEEDEYDDDEEFDDYFDDDDEFDDEFDDYWDGTAEGDEQVCLACLCALLQS
jgi:hypothetical protein